MTHRTILIAILLASLSTAVEAATISTTFASNNSNEGNMFDLLNISSSPVLLTGAFEGNFTSGESGVVQIWYRPGSYVGHETDRTGWTLLGTDGYTSAGINTPTMFDVASNLLLAPGTTFGLLMITSGETSATPACLPGSRRSIQRPSMGLGRGMARLSTQPRQCPSPGRSA